VTEAERDRPFMAYYTIFFYQNIFFQNIQILKKENASILRKFMTEVNFRIDYPYISFAENLQLCVRKF